MDAKHTPEPWRVVTHTAKIEYDMPDGIEFVTDCGRGEGAAAHAARIVACVNACAGIADPEAAIKAAREEITRGMMNMSITGWHRNDCPHHDDMDNPCSKRCESARRALALLGGGK